MPLSRSATVHVVAGVAGATDVVEQVAPPGLATTEYSVIVAPPSLLGGDHETWTLPLLGAADTAVAVPGEPGANNRVRPLTGT